MPEAVRDAEDSVRILIDSLIDTFCLKSVNLTEKVSSSWRFTV